MKAIYGLYSNPDLARRATSLLVSGAIELGVDQRNIAVISSEPFDDYALGRPEKSTPMSWLAALGGLVGGAGGYWLTALTQKAYPLPTGGMPIVPVWTDGIIVYEMTMLGAILCTLVTLLSGARLPSLGWKLYDPEVSNGKILVGVVSPPGDSRIAIQQRLREAGAERVKELT